MSGLRTLPDVRCQGDTELDHAYVSSKNWRGHHSSKVDNSAEERDKNEEEQLRAQSRLIEGADWYGATHMTYLTLFIRVPEDDVGQYKQF